MAGVDEEALRRKRCESFVRRSRRLPFFSGRRLYLYSSIGGVFMRVLSTILSFPGLGIESFELDPVAFPIGKFEIYWYAVLITLGMILAVLYALHHAKIERVKTDDVIDLALALIVCGVIGARLYYVIMEWDSYLVRDGSFFSNLWGTICNVVNTREGGLAIYGGIIGGFIAGYVVARKKRIPFPVIADIAGPSVIVGQIIGRFGNFMNVEAFGGPTTLPWRMCSPKIATDFLKNGLVDESGYAAVLAGELGAHPTFLYEALWNLIGLILITVLYKKKKFHGQMFLFYMAWYGFGRMLIEGLRTDSLYIGPLRVSQWVGGITFAVGVILMILGMRKAKCVPAFETSGSAEAESMDIQKEDENGSTD